MKLRHLTPALALILMTACGDDSTGVEPDDLAGTWTATAMVFTQTASPNQVVDVVPLGAGLTLVLGADASYTVTFVFPPDPDEVETGAYTVTGTNLNLSPTGTGSPETFTISRDGNTMTLTLADFFDFTEGVEEAATMVITLTR